MLTSHLDPQPAFLIVLRGLGVIGRDQPITPPNEEGPHDDRGGRR